MVQFGGIQELARKELSDYLEKYAGTKVLVWDEGLTGSMDLVAKFKFFQERSVIKMFPLKDGRIPKISTDNIVFVTRPIPAQMDKIADNVKGEEISGGGVRVDFHILFVPNKSLLCEKRLEDRGVLGSFAFLDELSISWFPLDTDVVSLERPNIFADFHLKNDPTCLYEMARAMMALQALYGFAPTVYGKGDAAKKLFEYMQGMKKELAGVECNDTISQLDTIIILDRKVDMITPFLTQLTYEGLIDEFFTIKNSTVRLPGERFAQDQPEASGATSDSMNTVKQLPLNSKDELYTELRDKNFNAVGPTLSRKAKAVSNAFGELKEAKDASSASLLEFKQFSKHLKDRLPQMKSLQQSVTTHTTIAEMIKEKTDSSTFLEVLQVEQELVNNQKIHQTLDFLEDAACQEVDMLRVLRVACLQCALSQGLKPKTLETYRKLILQAYGHVHLTSLINLEKSKLLYHNPSPSASSPYSILRKRLNLTQDDVNEQNPTDITYVHSVFAPMSIRLVQNCAKPGWRAIRDILDLIPAGPSFEEHQSSGQNKKRNSDAGGLKRALVVFIGGCTFAEIAALRFLSQQEDATTEYMVATTSIINGNSFLDGLLAKIHDSMASF